MPQTPGQSTRIGPLCAELPLGWLPSALNSGTGPEAVGHVSNTHALLCVFWRRVCLPKASGAPSASGDGQGGVLEAKHLMVPSPLCSAAPVPGVFAGAWLTRLYPQIPRHRGGKLANFKVVFR